MATSLNVRVVGTSLRRFSQKKGNELAAVVLTELRQDTPVLTGKARDGWFVQVGPGSASAASVRIGPIYVLNDVPYIGRLNDGWSDQAPPGFVQIAIARAVDGVGRIK